MEIPPLPNPYGFINGAQAVNPIPGEVSYIGNGPMRCSQRSGSQLLVGGADILLGNAILPPTACIRPWLNRTSMVSACLAITLKRPPKNILANNFRTMARPG